ncbi:formimidoylglutamate deiminase [Rhodobacteraceae bacterium 2376]|uniref:Formimidoylglutamate deiminase n=1 Tax=Rhabdonatronobacter sediminivivens TaxID=2743469 RepID=A0A7Z0I029_9RHOB|nr:formimidoylglutamate deiminase [Rhabdonatronobacter sediminivivens]NYS25451.1 formimidoylglutamate deiminase [Rhabdonatronobacter sediminivivens]
MTILHARHALLPDGWAQDVTLHLAQGRITRVALGCQTPPDHRADILLPAPANLHSHAFQHAMAGLTESRGPDPQDSFWTWRALMFRFLDQLTPEDIEAVTAYVQMRMLEAGFAACAEFHYLHHAPGGRRYADLAEMSARITAAAARSGIGLTLLPVLYEQGGCDGRPLAPGQDRFGNTPDRFAALLDGAGAALQALPGDARLGVAPHSLRAVSPEGLAACITLRPDAPLHMHLAEQAAEVAEVLAHHGARPVEWLLNHAPVDGRWCLIHCTQMQPHETRALAASGAVAGLCPITESSLGDGIFDGVRWMADGGAFGLGSDSNIRISLAEEMRTLEYSQRLRDHSRAALATPALSTGRRLWEGAARGGARAAGREAGAIAPGKLADLVALDGGHPDLAGLTGDRLLDALVFAADPGAVVDVWAAGRHMVRGGRHIDHDGIRRDYMAVRKRLLAV